MEALNGDDIQGAATFSGQADKTKLGAGQIQAMLQGRIQHRLQAVQSRQLHGQVIESLQPFVLLQID
jgi:hypothetical protein